MNPSNFKCYGPEFPQSTDIEYILQREISNELSNKEASQRS